MLNRLFKATIIFPVMLGLTSCALLDPKSHVQAERVNVDASYLDEPQSELQVKEVKEQEDKSTGSQVEYLTRLSGTEQGLTLELDLSDSIKSNKTFQVSVNALPLNDFIHYIFGELLDVSYLLEASVKANATPVTLNLKEEIPAKELFLLTQQILSQNNINIVKNDRVFYLHTSNANTKTEKAFGFGRTESSVPNVSGEIVQLVPILYDMKPSLRNIISQLVDARTDYDASQGLLTIVGLREQVIRSLSMIGLLDSPFMYNKSSALLSFEYINSETFTEKVAEILDQEGISVSKGGCTCNKCKIYPARAFRQSGCVCQ